MKLTSYCKVEFKVRSCKDRRNKVNRVVAEYTAGNGDKYRKGYEFPMIMAYDEMIINIPGEIKS